MKKITRLATLFTLLTMLFSCKTLNTPQQPKKSAEELFIDDTIAKMTTEEKITQMMIPSFRKWGDDNNLVKAPVTELPDEIAQTIKKHHFGGIIVFAENTPDEQTTENLITAMQNANNDGGACSKLFIGIDQEGGRVTRLKTGTMTCGNMALGATGDFELTKQSANIIGEELSSLGINLNFSPVMDINNNPANPIIGNRSFSDNPELVSKLGLATIEGLHEQKIMTAVKHFPGHGDTSTDSHTGLPCIYKTMEQISNLELIPYMNVLPQTDMIMTAHIRYPQIEKETYTSKETKEEITLPATLSKTFLTDFLRKKVNFNGIIITDSMVMDAVAKHFDQIDAAKLAINAGADIILMPMALDSPQALKDFDEYLAKITEMVKNGTVSEKRIDESVKRILSLKYKYGLFSSTENKESLKPTQKRKIGTMEHHQKEWEIALKAVTLLKNESETLPLKANQKVLVTVAYKGQVNSVKYAVQKLKEQGILAQNSEIEVQYIANPAEENAAELLADNDAVIAVMCLYGKEDMNPDEKDGKYSGFLDELLDECQKKNRKFVLLSAQLPYDTARFPKANAILACYNSRIMEEIPADFSKETLQYGPNIPAAIYTIFGGNNPSGHLPVSVPVLDSDYNYTQEILYKNGDGIGY